LDADRLLQNAADFYPGSRFTRRVMGRIEPSSRRAVFLSGPDADVSRALLVGDRPWLFCDPRIRLRGSEACAMKPSTEQDYRERILRTLVYIQQHLDDDLQLDQLASVAAFSRFHFHRIFRGMVG